ncbi:hypothetical protein BJ165DRAFT_1350259, partial [Panaeolus papilionaceus]
SDPPPSYSSIAPNGPDVSLLRERPPVRASNFTNVSVLNGAIQGIYAIDPAIHVPASLISPLSCGESEQDRKNLQLQTNNGAIKVELYISPTGYDDRSSMKRKRILISATTRNGSVKMNVPDCERLPIVLTCKSFNGAIELKVPRSFCGPLRLRTWNGKVQFSDAMKPSLTLFSQIDRVHRYFLGPMDSHQDVGDDWMGDELFAESMNGSIKVSYDDEVPVAQPKSQSFIGRLLFF